jgi:hypothetical protein
MTGQPKRIAGALVAMLAVLTFGLAGCSDDGSGTRDGGSNSGSNSGSSSK